MRQVNAFLGDFEKKVKKTEKNFRELFPFPHGERNIIGGGGVKN
jgi:hypothetical protein